jgi:hypothetical protein
LDTNDRAWDRYFIKFKKKVKVMKKILLIALLLPLIACNSMYIKPGTLDPTESVYSVAGGFSMKRSIKESMEKRGYKIYIGKQVTSKSGGTYDGGSIDMSEYKVENVRYVVNVNERAESIISWDTFFMPYCIFNGFWWWNFNVSIGDQKTGEEIFTWRGRGCANSSMRKLEDALDQLEMKKPGESTPYKARRIDTVKPG